MPASPLGSLVGTQSLPHREIGAAFASPLGGERRGLTRRKFIQSFFRYSILGGIMLLFGFILLKRKITVESRCTENFVCQSCKKYSKCNLPEKE